MKNAATRAVFAYWDALRIERVAPERSEIDPGAIRHVLADTFMIAVDPAAGHPFRLAGTRLAALFGRELKGGPFAGLWPGEAARDGLALVDIVAAEMKCVVAGLIGATREGEEANLELLLAPLRHRGATHARMLGVLSPGIVPRWLGLRPVQGLSLRSLRIVGTEREAEPALVAPADVVMSGPERRAQFVVYDGGK